ncbi:MAG TPA: carboxypeptidase regulatory-like domain-containing protein, partial [Vicinamibacterales bacterium]|nr:carboxypeptidase regulatory-like domain-containing protein [Vicinamibacterales bacterium]
MTKHRWFIVLLVSTPLAVGAGATANAWKPAAPQGPPRDARPAAQAPRDSAGAQEKPIAGKGAIGGVVVVAGSGQPARRARVTLTSPQEGFSGRTVMTDDSGAFTFAALPQGRYNLSASKPGYINGAFGQRIPGRSGTAIQLNDAQKLQVQLHVWRGSVITGTLLDEHGEAIPNTPVRAMRYVLAGGQRTLQQNGNAQTDDRGIYRIFGLQPGEYLVSATPRNVGGGPAVAEAARTAVVAALEQAGAGAMSAPQMEALAQRAATLRAEMPQSGAMAVGDDQSTGYAPVYYPGTTSPASAVSVTVGAGEEKGGVDFQYQVVPVARVEGIVTASAGQLPPTVSISLVNTGFNVPGLNPGGARVDASGAFRINNVPPGQYLLVARATLNSGREGGPGGRGMPLAMPGGRGDALIGQGRGRAGGPPDQLRLWGTADVNVDGRNVTNVVVMLQPGVQVTGRLAFDGASAQPPADLTRMRVTLQPAIASGSPPELNGTAVGRVEADGRFTLPSVVPGRYRLTASGAGTGWFLASSTIDGQDAVDFPIEIKSAVSGATVTFTDRVAELSGMVTNDQSQPVFDYTLIVYPADSRYRLPQSRRILTTRPATDGRFTFRNLPPGEYRLAPVLDPEPGSWFDPAFLQQLDANALRVSIAEG